MSETVISSFVLRFTQEAGGGQPWRGVVRHVQSDEEIRFTRIEEALRFMQRFVDLGEGDGGRLASPPIHPAGAAGDPAGEEERP
ncbi:MAG: hypothetical protein NZ528_06345 [Caldilineales bacterium]|nr:hypothetical protein [Caldilineales bacterium]MDW8319319.1 hypothetical protein [Anaerolineae bacterium]